MEVVLINSLSCPVCKGSDFVSCLHERERYPLTFWRTCSSCGTQVDIRHPDIDFIEGRKKNEKKKNGKKIFP